MLRRKKIFIQNFLKKNSKYFVENIYFFHIFFLSEFEIEIWAYVSDDFKTKKNSWEKKMIGIFDEMPLSAYLFRLESSIQ